MKKKTALVPATVLSKIIAPQTPKGKQVVAVDTDRVLIGLRACGVVIGSIDNDGKAIGLHASQVTTAVELTLRRNGIRVLSQAEAVKVQGAPFVCARITVMKQYFHAGIHLLEVTQPVRRPDTLLVGCITWTRDTSGTHGGDPGYIIDAIKEAADEFCNQWLKANPR